MKITLYVPLKPAIPFMPAEYAANVEAGRISPKLDKIATLLKCEPSQVDVLASGQGYTMYSVFDSEGKVNALAMQAFTELTGVQLNADWEEDQLRGIVLAITI
jgi:hypothetical protein